MTVVPKKAATVILLRNKEPGGFDVFLLKRHAKSSFMGGNYVYPGGRVDRDDGSLEICSLSRGEGRVRGLVNPSRKCLKSISRRFKSVDGDIPIRVP